MTTITDLGRADWLYDDELGCHIPSCSMYAGNWRCGNGPLEGDQITTGNCGRKHVPTRDMTTATVESTTVSGRTIGEVL